MKNNEIYQEHDYNDREEYLLSLSEDYGVDKDLVNTFADLLGPEEDFDMLVTQVEDCADEEGW